MQYTDIVIGYSCWTLGVNWTASYKTTLVGLSVRPPVTKFSQDWIISFFLIFCMIIEYFLKNKKKSCRPEFGPIRPKMRFCTIFLNLDHVFSLKLHTVIACDNV